MKCFKRKEPQTEIYKFIKEIKDKLKHDTISSKEMIGLLNFYASTQTKEHTELSNFEVLQCFTIGYYVKDYVENHFKEN
jgi:hypothetical protein